MNLERRLAEENLQRRPQSATIPLTRKTLVGPLIDSAAADRVETWVKNAEHAGARKSADSYGGERRSGNVISPWLLEAVPGDQPLALRGSFWACGHSCDAVANFDEAIARANASKYGLQDECVHIAPSPGPNRHTDTLECGAVLINLPTTFRLDSATVRRRERFRLRPRGCR